MSLAAARQAGPHPLRELLELVHHARQPRHLRAPRWGRVACSSRRAPTGVWSSPRARRRRPLSDPLSRELSSIAKRHQTLHRQTRQLSGLRPPARHLERRRRPRSRTFAAWRRGDHPHSPRASYAGASQLQLDRRNPTSWPRSVAVTVSHRGSRRGSRAPLHRGADVPRLSTRVESRAYRSRW